MATDDQSGRHTSLVTHSSQAQASGFLPSDRRNIVNTPLFIKHFTSVLLPALSQYSSTVLMNAKQDRIHGTGMMSSDRRVSAINLNNFI